ncbi:hypothetical protein B296_00002285 [Ensete ventricosum]|uniref:Uncharacterized protein n=1 Tax=Ensete ventricosum TaxID=4639 RepID=A0A427BBY4_ENSVE|nr:hypothetical protein B296_00002285 [Ensete ventricosum]
MNLEASKGASEGTTRVDQLSSSVVSRIILGIAPHGAFCGLLFSLSPMLRRQHIGLHAGASWELLLSSLDLVSEAKECLDRDDRMSSTGSVRGKGEVHPELKGVVGEWDLFFGTLIGVA